MDFHSLTRKELQTLCKRNKIPANITNVAMADALKALEIVEGLDDFMNESQSPEKTMNKPSQEVPTTVTRTSTRRRATKEEPQSTQPTTRTQRMTRRTMELDEENKNVNVPETPVTTSRRKAQKTESEAEEQKKSDLLETPALQSGRRRPGVGSTRRKVEAQKEASVQQGYGTRRSVRLLEKCMTGLSLKDGEGMEPAKIDGMEEKKNGQSEAPADVPLARNLSESLEHERELEEVLENSKCYDSDGNDCTVISEAGSQKSDNLDTKDASPDEKTVESDAYLAESTADKLVDMSDRTVDPKGSDDVAASEDSDDNDNTDEELVAKNNEGFHANETKSKDVPVADAFENISEEALNHSSSADEELVAENNGGSHADETKSIDLPVGNAFEKISEEALDHSSSAEFMEPIGFESVCAANHAPQNIECQKLAGKDCNINAVMLNDLAKFPEAEEYDGGNESHMDSFEKMGNEESDNNSLADELQVSCEQESIFIPTVPYISEDPMIMVNEEALVDVNVAEQINHVVESSFQNVPKSVVRNVPIHMLDYRDAEALVDVAVNPAEEFEETLQEVPPEEKSPTAATSGPLSSVKAQFSHFTPRKSSGMKQTTIPKVISDNSNKENIDNNSMEVEPNLRKVKQSKSVIIDEETMQKLESMSLRNLKKLSKMFDKLQIADNKPLGKNRPALQTLPQNCMSTGEAEKQN